jgi:hypothetical protein
MGAARIFRDVLRLISRHAREQPHHSQALIGTVGIGGAVLRT